MTRGVGDTNTNEKFYHKSTFEVGQCSNQFALSLWIRVEEEISLSSIIIHLVELSVDQVAGGEEQQGVEIEINRGSICGLNFDFHSSPERRKIYFNSCE